MSASAKQPAKAKAKATPAARPKGSASAKVRAPAGGKAPGTPPAASATKGGGGGSSSRRLALRRSDGGFLAGEADRARCAAYWPGAGPEIAEGKLLGGIRKAMADGVEVLLRPPG